MYPMGTGVQYVDIHVTVDAASWPSTLVSPRLVTSFTGPSRHNDEKSERAGFTLTAVPGSPGFVARRDLDAAAPRPLSRHPARATRRVEGG